MTDKSAAAIREFAEKQFPLSKELKKEVLYNQMQQAKQNECFSDLTALISEHYYPKEFVKWFDAKQGWGRVMIDDTVLYVNLYKGSNIKYTLDELFNYWKENER